MTKVIIDAFDTEEQAVAFVDWLRKQMDAGKCRTLTIAAGEEFIDWDGIDHSQTNKDQITLNIVPSFVETTDNYIWE